jgi:hypothetical protein
MGAVVFHICQLQADMGHPTVGEEEEGSGPGEDGGRAASRLKNYVRRTQPTSTISTNIAIAAAD